MRNSSTYYSSLFKQTNETQKQSSKSIDFQSVNSSCVTSKELKSINNFRSTIHNFYKNMKKNKTLSLNLFHSNNLNSNFYETKISKHNFTKTKSYDSILPNILEVNTTNYNKKSIKNLKKSIKIDPNLNCNNNNNNKNIPSPLNISNFSTTFNSLITPKSNLSNDIKFLKSEYSCTIINNNKNKKRLSLNNVTHNDTNYDYNYNIYREKIKRDNLNDYLYKTKKIILYKYIHNEFNKLINLEKEKIETKIEKQNLDLNLLEKLYFLFKKYIYSYDSYYYYIKENVKNIKLENTYLIEKKKKLNNEIFSLGNRVFRIKNRFKDYLSNKYFLLSVKNHTKNFNYFTTKDKSEFNHDLSKLDTVEKKLDSLFINSYNEENNEEEKEEKEIDINESIRKYSSSNKLGFKQFDLVKKRFYSQKSIVDSIAVKNIFNSPKQFIKDLNLISKGINDSLKRFNKNQIDLLNDKKLLNNLNKKSSDSESIEKEFDEKEYELKNKLDNALIYYKYLKNYKNNLVSKYENKHKNKDFLLIRIKYIFNNIKNSGDEKLLKYLDNLNINEIISNKYNNKKLNNSKLNFLKIIEDVIIFLQSQNNECKQKDKERFLKIETKVKYISCLNNFKQNRENDKIKKQLKLLKILEKSNNIPFLPNKKNYYINNHKMGNKFQSRNNKNDVKKYKTVYDIDLNI